MKHSKGYYIFWIIAGLSLVGLLAVFVIFLFGKAKEEEPDPGDKNEPTPAQKTKLTEHFKLILDTLKEEGVDDYEQRSQFYTAQAAHETGNFTSKVYLENNNMFGMKNPVQRQTTSKGEKNGYADYASLKDSIIDRLLWDKAKQIEYTDDLKDFCSIIKQKNYYEDTLTNYYKGCKAWAATLVSQLNYG